MYVFLLFLHITGAVVGIGASFAFPMIAKRPKTVTEAKFVLGLLHKLEILPKVGSITLLLTGLIMGFLNTALFTTGWYIASIIIYILVQFIVVGKLPKNMKRQVELLENETTEQLPAEYLTIAKQNGKLEGYTHVAAIILIILMVFKPF